MAATWEEIKNRWWHRLALVIVNGFSILIATIALTFARSEVEAKVTPPTHD